MDKLFVEFELLQTFLMVVILLTQRKESNVPHMDTYINRSCRIAVNQSYKPFSFLSTDIRTKNGNWRTEGVQRSPINPLQFQAAPLQSLPAARFSSRPELRSSVSGGTLTPSRALLLLTLLLAGGCDSELVPVFTAITAVSATVGAIAAFWNVQINRQILDMHKFPREREPRDIDYWEDVHEMDRNGDIQQALGRDEDIKSFWSSLRVNKGKIAIITGKPGTGKQTFMVGFFDFALRNLIEGLDPAKMQGGFISLSDLESKSQWKQRATEIEEKLAQRQQVIISIKDMDKLSSRSWINSFKHWIKKHEKNPNLKIVGIMTGDFKDLKKALESSLSKYLMEWPLSSLEEPREINWVNEKKIEIKLNNRLEWVLFTEMEKREKELKINISQQAIRRALALSHHPVMEQNDLYNPKAVSDLLDGICTGASKDITEETVNQFFAGRYNVPLSELQNWTPQS